MNVRSAILLLLLIYLGGSQGTGEIVGLGGSQGTDEIEGETVESQVVELPPISARSHEVSVELGEPILHEDELAEGCENGQSGDSLLVAVNKHVGQELRCSWKPDDLTRLSRRYLVPSRSRRERSIKLRRSAARALSEMMQSAREEGVVFYVRSGYRSYREQVSLYHHKVHEHGERHAARFSAEAGRSQHQLGTTIDLTTEGMRWQIEYDFAATLASDWLSENAYRFGYSLSYPEGHEELTGYAFEPWHYRYVGAAAAEEQHRSGYVLEEYLQICQNDPGAFLCPNE